MPILADYKTMDSGFKNVLITQREGGHYMTVCANAADETVKSAIAEGKKTGIKVVTDTIGVKDQAARARQCVEWGVDMIYLHFGADQRRAHPDRRWRPVGRVACLPSRASARGHRHVSASMMRCAACVRARRSWRSGIRFSTSRIIPARSRRSWRK